jgi:hypothetical protein
LNMHTIRHGYNLFRAYPQGGERVSQFLRCGLWYYSWDFIVWLVKRMLLLSIII